MSFDTVLEKYRKEAKSKSELGSKFERLILNYLKTVPEFQGEFDSVCLWKDFEFKNQFGGHDIGIDLVAKTVSGEFWAIQCKCFHENHNLSKDDIDSFLSTMGKMFTVSGVNTSFSKGLLISSAETLGRNAEQECCNRGIQIIWHLHGALTNADVDWDKLDRDITGAGARKEPHKPLPHQQKAIDAAVLHYSSNDRGKLIMACGTGKTFTSLKIMEALADGRPSCVLFLCPSISLVGQNMREWMRSYGGDVMVPICVCSDPKASDNDEFMDQVSSLGYPATTDSDLIAKRYEDNRAHTVVVFSTYQSLDSIIEAQEHGLPEFDLMICDEAHRTTGVVKDKTSNFIDVHDGNKVHAKHRMYMTATPRIYRSDAKDRAKAESAKPYSMDDESIYGKEFYRYSFSEAVDDGRLSDYKVLVLALDETKIPPEIQKEILQLPDSQKGDYFKAWGCLNALAKKGNYNEPLPEGEMKSAVIFTSTIKRSRDVIVKHIEKIATKESAPLHPEIRHIDGSMGADKRNSDLSWLRKAEEGQTRILSNVRCLTEGVDVPALDAVVFFGAKSSQVDIVQSVGRVMRVAEGKKYGYIIIPILTRLDGDSTEELDNNEQYEQVWAVVKALRSHDERMSVRARDFVIIGSLSIEPGLDPKPFVERYDPWQSIPGGYIEGFYGKIVDKVGEREYYENWANKMANITPELRRRLEKICAPDGAGAEAFDKYLKRSRSAIHSNISREDAINMLIQQYVTKPIFDKLFGDCSMENNSVFASINEMMESIDVVGELDDVGKTMDDFRRSTKNILGDIDRATTKQHVIKSIYEEFYKYAFRKDQAINGIVYTPIEIVDFIINSVNDVLQKEFDRSLTDKGVTVLDPFTGTGTFIARLIESGLIDKDDLERKYQDELFANEIMLLAYYVAAVNITNAYAIATGANTALQFENILLTDTFNIEQLVKSTADAQTTLEGNVPFGKNRRRIRKENETSITVILGNPPYGANQKSANDDAKKRTYRSNAVIDGKEIVSVDGRIKESYLNDAFFTDTKKGNVNSVYDNYVRAFRWATDRLRGGDGVIAFVTPNGWLSSDAFVGFRKTIEREFDSIYVFNLRGDQNGGDWRNEGEKVFGEGSKVGICVTMLIRRRGHSGKALIRYIKVDDAMKRKAKLQLLNESKSFPSISDKMEIITPKKNGDWTTNRSEHFHTLIPIAGDTRKKFENHCEETIFVGYSRGYATCRDAWAYSYSESMLKEAKARFIEGYLEQLEKNARDKTDSRVKWTTPVTKSFSSKKRLSCSDETVVPSVYRPFCKRFMDNDADLNEAPYQMPRIYPAGAENRTICVAGEGVKKDFSCLMTDMLTDLNCTGASQCFPLYWYENTAPIKRDARQSVLFETESRLIRHDGISDWALREAKRKYGDVVTKEDIFYYVYGYLHSPDYREEFCEDLKHELPRIDFVDDIDDFRHFAEAGRKLAELHVGYEDAEFSTDVIINGGEDIDSVLSDEGRLRVTKMRLFPEQRKLVYNGNVTIENIPESAFRYVVNGRSAIGWIVDQYCCTVDKESGITNDPNEYAGSAYILKLVLSVITVSVETTKIVDSLPKLKFGDGGQTNENGGL